MSYIQYIVSSIINPLRGFRGLYEDEKSHRYGWWTTLGFAFLYSLTALILFLRGFTPFTPPSLPLNKESYYLYQTFFTIPVGVVGVLISAGLVLIICRLFGYRLSFHRLWGPLSLASCIPSLICMWLPETMISLLVQPNQWDHLTFDLIRIGAGSFWTIVLTVLAVLGEKSVKWRVALAAGIPAAGLMGMLMAICYR